MFLQLCPESNKLELIAPKEYNLGPLSIDFEKISQKDLSLNLPLARACGLKKSKNIKQLNIIDGTAGLGRESFILAYLGANVTMVEHNEKLCLLLQDALNRAKSNLKLNAAIGRVKLVNCEILQYLAANSPEVDVIYLDPMFEQKFKAQVKKEMQYCRILTHNVGNVDDLVATSLQFAPKVVLKIPSLMLKEVELWPIKPSHKITSGKINYLVFQAH